MFCSYLIKLAHDCGTLAIKVKATSFESAVRQILASEKCPEGAILSIVRL